MFYQDRLIIGYIQEPESNRYLFQLTGGEELATTRSEFFAHWNKYCEFEKERAAQHVEHYSPLPVTFLIRQSIEVYPINVSQRRMNKGDK